MNRVSSLIIEAGPSFRLTAIGEGRLRIELEDVEVTNSEAPPSAIYDKRGLAKRLGVSRRSVDNFMKQKTSPLPYTVSMGRVRFLESDVLAWLKDGSSVAARRANERLFKF